MKAKVSKKEWYKMGGLRNPNLWRKQRKGRGWEYYVTVGSQEVARAAKR